MNKEREKLFIDELNTQIEFAIISIENLNECLEKIGSFDEFDNKKFWYYSQNFIVYSANISKILWGLWNKQNPKKSQLRKKERIKLRNVLNVSETSLLKSRDLRNALEHIDERLEEFSEDSNFIILNKNIGPIKNFIQIDGEAYDMVRNKNLRHYDQTTKIYYFYGESINLQDLADNIAELKKSIDGYRKSNDSFYPYH